MEYKIYKLTSPEGKVYIGLTKMSLSRRWSAGSGYRRNVRLFADILTYGWINFTHEIIAIAANKEDGLLLEAKYIAEYDSANPEKGYNGHSNKSTVRRSALRLPKYECVETNKQYYTQQEIADEVGVTRSRVSQCITSGETLRGLRYVAVKT